MQAIDTRTVALPSAPHVHGHARPATLHRESLVPLTLKEMEEDTELLQHLDRVQREGQAALTREERLIRQRALDHLQVPSFATTCKVR